MELRVLEMMNNFPEGMTGTAEIGRYCALGYYDALDLDTGASVASEFPSGASFRHSSWEARGRAVMKRINGDVKVINLCLAFRKGDVKKETDFWNDEKDAFLGISILRTESLSGIAERVDNENKKSDRMAYYSYEHCETLVAYHTNSYNETVSRVRELRDTFHALKIYTIFAVREDLLKDRVLLQRKMETSMKKEMISVRMNATMRNPQKVGYFHHLLESALKTNEDNTPKIRIYDLLGDDDILIEIDDVPLINMLVLYQPGGLLHHTNKDYKAAFHNIETRFLRNTNGIDEYKVVEQESTKEDGEKREEKLKKEKDINWIKDRMQELKALYDICATSEEALSSYIVCMVKLLNGLIQIRSSDLHIYERMILFKPIETFTKYFIEQTKKAMSEKRTIQKIEIVQDIENAICRVSDIYENVVNGTANTDKQMFMSLPVNSSIYELSPRLYAHYSDLICEMSFLFDEKNQYAVFLNPTLQRVLKEEVLFETREERGKVVVVDIPVGMLDDYDYLPLWLIHELFHVLTSEERCRKKRAIMLVASVTSQIQYLLFEHVSFSTNLKVEMLFQNVLIQRWLSRTLEDFKGLEGLQEDSKEFYSLNISIRVGKCLQSDLYRVENRILKDLHIVAELVKQSAKDGTLSGIFEYQYKYEDLVENAELIRKNLRTILSGNRIPYLIKKMMFLFKETYADVATQLVVPDFRESYPSAFAHAVQFHVEEEELNKDRYMFLRRKIVNKVLDTKKSDVIEKGVLNQVGETIYDEVRQELQSKRANGVNFVKSENSSLQEIPEYAIVNRTVIQSCLEYLYDCKELLSNRIEELQKVDSKHLHRLKEKAMIGKNCGIIDIYN